MVVRSTFSVIVNDAYPLLEFLHLCLEFGVCIFLISDYFVVALELDHVLGGRLEGLSCCSLVYIALAVSPEQKHSFLCTD
jgi:hypothetical protein